jgi:hypothetical protein
MSALLPFYWFLLVLLASRVLLILRDDPLAWRHAAGLSLVQAAALLAAAPSVRLLPLILVIAAANLAGAWLEQRDPPRAGPVRLGVLVVTLLAAGFTFAPVQGIAPSPMLVAAGDWLARHLLFFQGLAHAPAGGTALMLVLIGALLVMHEANLLIRAVLQLIRVVPQSRAGDDAAQTPGDPALILPPRRAGEPPQRLDQREYNAGRFIGVLERLLTYAFVLQGQYAAIGLILAAKGFARFREMDERDFAEYVLIGTLLSVASAVLVAEAVKALLP